jgi:hypothetical protein
MSLLDDRSIGRVRGTGGRQNIAYTEFISMFDKEREASGDVQPPFLYSSSIVDSTTTSTATTNATSGSSTAATSCTTNAPSPVRWSSHIEPRIHRAIAEVFLSARAVASRQSHRAPRSTSSATTSTISSRSDSGSHALHPNAGTTRTTVLERVCVHMTMQTVCMHVCMYVCMYVRMHAKKCMHASIGPC